jgi:hypothetical protein
MGGVKLNNASSWCKADFPVSRPRDPPCGIGWRVTEIVRISLSREDFGVGVAGRK